MLRSVGWSLDVQHDLGLHTEFFGNVHGIAAVSMRVVMDGDAHTPPSIDILTT